MFNPKDIRKMDASELERLADDVYSSIRNIAISTHLISHSYFEFVYAAYLASLNHADNTKALRSLIVSRFEPRTLYEDDKLNLALQLAKEHSAVALLAYMYVCPKYDKDEEVCRTPESISRLALKILDAQPGETIADFGCGFGDFLLLSSALYEKNSLYGIEFNPYVNEISKIRAELFSENIEIELGDMFELPENKKFDKIFSNYPFPFSLQLLRSAPKYIETLRKRCPEIRQRLSSDWVFNSLILDHLTDDGKAVAIMTAGSAFNTLDREIRKYFIKSGFVEAVIWLPVNINNFTNISTGAAMIVLSKRNKSVKMINARELCEQGRRVNLLTDSNIDSIVKLLAEDGENAVTVDLKRLQENDYTLNPLQYLKDPAEIKDGVKFGSLIKRVTRGAALKASELDEMISEDPTDAQYLMLANIQDGIISDELPYLKYLDSKLDKYCIKDRNLLLSKNGAPFKVAVAEVEEGKKLLGNGNLFIIELDEQKVNPYYLQAYLNSETGTEALRSIAVGAVIPNISIESLKRLTVPLPPMDKQNEIVEEFQTKREKIKSLQSKLQMIQNELKYYFSKEK